MDFQVRMSEKEATAAGLSGRIGVILLSGFLLMGCATWMPKPDAWEALSKSSSDYNRLIRWSKFDEACLMYVDETMSEQCRVQAESLDELHVTDIKIRDISFNIDQTDATVRTEIEYYVMPSVTVKKVQDVQKWRYTLLGEKKVWKLRSLLPDFAAR